MLEIFAAKYFVVFFFDKSSLKCSHRRTTGILCIGRTPNSVTTYVHQPGGGIQRLDTRQPRSSAKAAKRAAPSADLTPNALLAVLLHGQVHPNWHRSANSLMDTAVVGFFFGTTKKKPGVPHLIWTSQKLYYICWSHRTRKPLFYCDL